MTNDLLQRVDAIERLLDEIRPVIARNQGESRAAKVALLGLVSVAGQYPEVRDAVDSHLERSYASLLARDAAQECLTGFEQFAELVQVALADKG